MRYRLVPEEPTIPMTSRFAIYCVGHGTEGDRIARGYRAMLSSAPVFEPSDACVEKVARAIRAKRGYMTAEVARAAIEAFQKAVADGT